MRRKTGFTLIELLVVIGIIALLISILLPSLSRARTSAKNVKCLSNLRQIGAGFHLYASDHESRLPPMHIGYKPTQLRVAGTNNYGPPGSDGDVRPVLEGYVEYNLLQCPFPQQLDLDKIPGPQIVESSYVFYADWGWNDGPAGRKASGSATSAAGTSGRRSPTPATSSRCWPATSTSTPAAWAASRMRRRTRPTTRGRSSSRTTPSPFRVSPTSARPAGTVHAQPSVPGRLGHQLQGPEVGLQPRPHVAPRADVREQGVRHLDLPPDPRNLLKPPRLLECHTAALARGRPCGVWGGPFTGRCSARRPCPAGRTWRPTGRSRRAT